MIKKSLFLLLSVLMLSLTIAPNSSLATSLPHPNEMTKQDVEIQNTMRITHSYVGPSGNIPSTYRYNRNGWVGTLNYTHFTYTSNTYQWRYHFSGTVTCVNAPCPM
ncbi:hypothetical protein JOC54_003552 [Alkalihalobacillus xiaoxiensis]|uniref:Uncharacterized protein n=1 Tax=Shouchella xiaoxiensis TaxID=766895 RepID=A0ABS2SYJ3_9BACI|nr:hypothetical protein [Shouchella xiaoxiensis]MBM7840271.1 hypothetical protein [Shouchella xiaoxiensis]